MEKRAFFFFQTLDNPSEFNWVNKYFSPGKIFSRRPEPLIQLINWKIIIGVKGGKLASPRERDTFWSGPRVEGDFWTWFISVSLSLCVSVSLSLCLHRKHVVFDTFFDIENTLFLILFWYLMTPRVFRNHYKTCGFCTSEDPVDQWSSDGWGVK